MGARTAEQKAVAGPGAERTVNAAIRSFLEGNPDAVLEVLQRRVAAVVEAAGLLRRLFGRDAGRDPAIAAIAEIVVHERRRARGELSLARDGSFDRDRIRAVLSASCDLLLLCGRCSDRVDVYGLRADPAGASAVVELLFSAARSLLDAVSSVRSGTSPAVVSSCTDARRFVDEAGAMLDRTLSALFASDQSELGMVEWKDICDVLEAVLRKCRTVADSVQALGSQP